jgi:hypothetical protein
VRKARLSAFTLVELMNALAITCVVGTLAMYFVARYVRHAKTAEAIGSITAIGEGSVRYFETSDLNQPAGTRPESARAMRHFPPTSHTSVPADADMVKGKRYQSSLADWSASPWSELHFAILQPQFYVYSYSSDARGGEATATATAHGDLDGNGVSSTYELTVKPDDQLSAQIAPMVKTNPEE